MKAANETNPTASAAPNEIVREDATQNRTALSKKCDPQLVAEIRRNPPQVLSVQETAWYLSCSDRKIREDIYRRRISAIRMGGRVFVRLCDLQRDLVKLSVPAL